MTEQNTGTVILSGNNSFTGTYTIAGGTLEIGSITALNAGAKLLLGANRGSSDATLNIGGFNVTVSSLTSGTTTGAKVITNNGSAANFNVANTAAAITFDGSFQNGTGAFSLTKSGTKTLSLAGVNTYTGATVVTGGALQLTAANALQNTASITVNSGGTLETTVANAITASGTIQINSGGTLLLSGTSTNAINNTAPHRARRRHHHQRPQHPRRHWRLLQRRQHPRPRRAHPQCFRIKNRLRHRSCWHSRFCQLQLQRIHPRG